MKFILFIFALAVVLGSCEKNEWERIAPEDKILTNKAFLKIYNAVLGSPSTNIFVDGTMVMGGTSPVGYTGLFPASVTYSSVEAGAHVIKVADVAATPLLNITANNNFEAGKYYTLFLYDTLNTAKSKLVQDDIQVPADTTARVRFGNFLFSSVAIPNMDIYSQRLKANVFSNIPVGEVTNYVNHPSKLQDTFYLRATGTTTNLNSVIFTPDQRRSYTLLGRGRYQTTSGTIVRTLTVMTNR
ncbi:MAG TPA: DUF4397 domain-containing protein [Chitinophagaceae bacterium]